MMEAVRAWLTSVVLVSVLLSAAQSLIPPGTVRKAAGFTGGLILLLVLTWSIWSLISITTRRRWRNGRRSWPTHRPRPWLLS